MNNEREICKLAFLVTGFPPNVSGVSLFNWERAQWFSRQSNYQVAVFAPDFQNSRTKHSIDTSNSIKNLTVERYPSKPWLPYPLNYVPKIKATNQINQKLRSHQPDIVVVTDVEQFFFLSAWQLPGYDYVQEFKIPYIAEYHTDIYNFSAAYQGWQWLRNAAHLFRIPYYLYRNFDATLCSSIAAAESCRNLGIPNTATVPFLGIDISMYNPNRRNRQCLKPWLTDEEQNNKVILFLGRLGFEKRVDLLISAFKKLQCKQLNCSLAIAGDGPIEVVNYLEDLAKSIPNIHFLGFVEGEAKANLMASCDIFCSPSPYETFGRTIVEAMASGIPVITVNSGAVSEYIVDGVNGHLVPPNNINKLVNSLAQALIANNQTITQKAVQDANQLSIERGCIHLNNYYQKLLKSHQNLFNFVLLYGYSKLNVKTGGYHRIRRSYSPRLDDFKLLAEPSFGTKWH
ncbi:MAG: glycosyltransferase family 4 protein [Chloroflexaceae bacterium]|nr:glycosyltransferase family 4 protein [Chloroflexaceae bacterium]